MPTCTNKTRAELVKSTAQFPCDASTEPPTSSSCIPNPHAHTALLAAPAGMNPSRIHTERKIVLFQRWGNVELNFGSIIVKRWRLICAFVPPLGCRSKYHIGMRMDDVEKGGYVDVQKDFSWSTGTPITTEASQERCKFQPLKCKRWTGSIASRCLHYTCPKIPSTVSVYPFSMWIFLVRI